MSYATSSSPRLVHCFHNFQCFHKFNCFHSFQAHIIANVTPRPLGIENWISADKFVEIDVRGLSNCHQQEGQIGCNEDFLLPAMGHKQWQPVCLCDSWRSKESQRPALKVTINYKAKSTQTSRVPSHPSIPTQFTQTIFILSFIDLSNLRCPRPSSRRLRSKFRPWILSKFRSWRPNTKCHKTGPSGVY